jgi:hypothetical protein
MSHTGYNDVATHVCKCWGYLEKYATTCQSVANSKQAGVQHMLGSQSPAMRTPVHNAVATEQTVRKLADSVNHPMPECPWRAPASVNLSPCYRVIGEGHPTCWTHTPLQCVHQPPHEAVSPCQPVAQSACHQPV